MNNIEKKIYEDISESVLDYLSNSNVEYDIESENNTVQKSIQKYSDMPSIDKERELKGKLISRLIHLLNYCQKTVSSIPRKVYFSDYLVKKINADMSDEIKDKINVFKEKFENGEDINSNLSKLIFNSNSWDYLLNIWNIRHLHLSESVKFDKGEMSNNRSEYLLFFVIYYDSVYFIDVRNHPRGSGFTSFSFLEILEENKWLKFIGFEEIKDISNLKPIVNKDEDIYQITKLGGNLFYEINNKYYGNIFGGISNYGNNWNINLYINKIRKMINYLSKKPKIEYIKFELLLNRYFGVIKYKVDSEEKELIL